MSRVRNGMRRSGRARVNFSQVASVEAPDPHTVVFHLKTPYPGFIYAFETSSAPSVTTIINKADTIPSTTRPKS